MGVPCVRFLVSSQYLTQVAVGDERPELVTARKKITLAMK
jgi:hypothetical protein